MFGNRATQYVVFAGVLAVLLLILGWRIFSGNSIPSPERLASLALSDAAETEREQAALQLARHPGQPLVQLRHVFQQSSSPRVRAGAAIGLGLLRDWQSMPQLVEAMRDDSQLLRGRAAMAVNRIVAQDFGFRADAPPEQRRQVIELVELKWPRLHKGFLVKQRLIEAGEQPKPKPKKRPPNT